MKASAYAINGSKIPRLTPRQVAMWQDKPWMMSQNMDNVLISLEVNVVAIEPHPYDLTNSRLGMYDALLIINQAKY